MLYSDRYEKLIKLQQQLAEIEATGTKIIAIITDMPYSSNISDKTAQFVETKMMLELEIEMLLLEIQYQKTKKSYHNFIKHLTNDI